MKITNEFGHKKLLKNVNKDKTTTTAAKYPMVTNLVTEQFRKSLLDGWISYSLLLKKNWIFLVKASTIVIASFYFFPGITNFSSPFMDLINPIKNDDFIRVERF